MSKGSFAGGKYKVVGKSLQNWGNLYNNLCHRKFMSHKII